MAKAKWNLRRHFVLRHPQDLVEIPGEGVYPQCRLCGMQTSPLAFNHEGSKLCLEGTARREQCEAEVDSVQALQVQFTAYGEPLEKVEVFKYLGRLLAFDDNDI